MAVNRDSKTSRRRYEPCGDRVAIFKRGRFWHAHYVDGGRQRRVALGTTDARTARQRAAELDRSLVHGPAPAEPPTVEQAADMYLAYLRTEGRRPKTLTKYRDALHRFGQCCGRLGIRHLGQLGLRVMDSYRAERVDAGRAAKTIYLECTIVRQLVNFACSRGLLDRDPLRGLRIAKPKPRRQPFWTPAQMDAILAAAPEPQCSYLCLLRETGLRIGELVHLTWPDVDLARGFLHVRAKGDWRPKTGDERSVPLSPAARQVLEALPRRGRWVATMPPTAQNPRRDRPLSDRWLLSQLKRILARLGLPGHLHTFRHSFISHALNRGIPESIVRQWVGHVDRDVIRLYTHVGDEVSLEAMRRLVEQPTVSEREG